MKGYLTRGSATGTWYLRVELPRTVGKRRQRRETVRGTKGEAQRRLRELLREVEAGGYAGNDRLTVAALAQRWLAAKEHRVAAKTYAFYAAHVRLYLLPAIGSLRLEALRPAHIEAAIGAWARGNRNDREEGVLSGRTVTHVFNTLRTILRWGVKMGSLVRNVAEAVDPPRFDRKEMRVLDPVGVAQLLRAAEGTELTAVVAVAIGTGLRRGELLALRWSDVNLDARRLAVHRSLETVKGVTRTKPPKTARSARTIALPPFVADILRAERLRQETQTRNLGVKAHEDGWIFRRADGSSWEPGAFSLAFARFVKRAKLPHVRFHDLRHSFGTLALASGVDLQTVSRALGHESTAITSRIYLHAVEALQEDAAARIDALLGSAVARAVDKPQVPSKLAESVPRRCHEIPPAIKKARQMKLFFIAPTGIEPVVAGYVVWPNVNLTPEQSSLFDRCCSKIGYLGRSESWCTVTVTTTLPANDALEIVDLASRSQLDGPTVRRLAAELSLRGDPLLRSLSETTGQMRKDRRLMPRGAKWVEYRLPPNFLMVREQFDRPDRTQPVFGPSVLRFSLERGEHSPRPSIKDVVVFSELLRAASIKRLSDRESEPATRRLAGKADDGSKREGHDHPYFLPFDSLGRGEIDGIDVWFPAGCTHPEYLAVTTVTELREHAIYDDKFALTSLGKIQRTRSRVWQSATPVVLERFPKIRGSNGNRQVIDAPDAQLQTMIRRAVGCGARVSIWEPTRGIQRSHGGHLRLDAFRRMRIRKPTPPLPVAGATLEFDEPVEGPIVLGRLAHFGLGQFEPLHA